MIIRKLHLGPFAGLVDQTVNFHPDLTVVLGPNEAGKSTLMAALRLLLFTPSNCGKLRFQKEVAPYMPLGGGDTIRAELEFSVDRGAEPYRLSVSWGEGAHSELRLPDGNLLAGDQAVRQRLDEVLVLREGTWRSMLFSDQSDVARVLDNLGAGEDPVTDLAAILRRAVFETDGIFLEQLERAIEEQHTGYFRRWDRELNRPENNRGIDNPYSREVGLILAVHYQRERARRTRDQALEHEQELDRMSSQLNELAAETRLLVSFLEENRQAADDARRRTVMELERQALAQDEESLRRITAAWPALEQEVKGLTVRREALVETRDGLDKELELSAAAAAVRQDAEVLKRAEKEHKAWREADSALANLRPVSKEDLLAVVTLHQEIQQLTAGLRAGRITVSLTPKTPLELTSRRDIDQPTEHRLAAGERLELEAGGQISLDHPQWSLSVNSGDADAGDPLREHERLTGEFTSRLAALGLSSLADAETARAAFAAAEHTVETCRHGMNTVLDGETIEALRVRVPQGADPGGHRTVEVIAREQERTAGEIREIDRAAGKKRQQLSDWDAEFQTPEILLDRLLEKRSALKAVDEQLAALTPLPEGTEDASGFVARFENCQTGHREKNETLTRLRLEQMDLQNQGPGVTLEEAEAALQFAETEEQKVLREAAALDRIRVAFAEVRLSLDAETMDPWNRELERVVPLLTGGRYQGMEGESGLARQLDGTAIPAGRLSLGTRAGVGLAVRLSMARWFLQADDGFLILDDPMVDMDPQRQAAATVAIAEFSTERQTIIFTCHPAHAAQLGGSLVQLDPPGGEE
jgi:exonuclease SbcC